MKKGIASSDKPVQYGLDQKDANAPLEAKRAAEIDTVKATKDNADSEKPVEAPTASSTDPAKMNQSNPNSAYTSAVGPATNGDSKPQAAAAEPSSSEFKFSDEQEKWLGKANRQDPYILARMPGDKPPIDYFKSDDDKKIAKKVGYGISNWNAVKSVAGAEKTKSWGEEKMQYVNKKFNITDALYHSVMEVMKKDSKEGSIPRNEKEKDLAAFHGDPKRITHGDVLKARGVTKEEVANDDIHPAGVTLLKQIKPQHRNLYKPHLTTDVFNGSYKDRTDILKAAEDAGHLKEDVEQVSEMSSKMKMKLGLYGKKKKTNESVDKGGKLEIEDRKKLEMDKKNSPENRETGMTRGTRPRTAAPGFGKDDIPDSLKNANPMGRIVGGVWQSDPKGKVPMPKGDQEPVRENKDTPGNGYAHQCAVHVKSESFGEGRTITTQHADPDTDGNIAWYDVMFEHGIEKQVPTNTLEILVSEMHMHSKKKKKMM